MKFPDWSDEVAVVLASGPSVGKANLALIQGYRVIAVNSSYKLYPYADALYATDLAWWKQHNGARDFKGIKLSAGRHVKREFPDVIQLHVPPTNDPRRPTMIFEPRGTIGSGGNSGFQALNCAIQFGARRIILLGFDMRVDMGSHWHGDHTGALRNPEAVLIDKWRAALDKQAPVLARHGVQVINASHISALTGFPRFTLEEACHVVERAGNTERKVLVAEVR
jgi:hypothetical protein